MAAPAAAKGGGKGKPAAGRLDRSFSKDGKLLLAFPPENAGGVGVKYALPFQFKAGQLVMAPSPGGKTVVAGSTQLVRVLPSGNLDRRFGTRGTVKVPRPAGMTFVLADIAVDSQGRILLAGTARPQPTSSTPDPLISAAAVIRFDADGNLDRGFGKEGILVTDFGIKPPTVPTGEYLGSSLGLMSIAVDSQGRPVLTGAAVIRASFCRSSETVTNGFVARLTSAGAPDPSFGEGGLRTISDLASFGEANVLRSKALLAVGVKRSGCEYKSPGAPVLLTEFGPEGNLRPSFGLAGFRSVNFDSAPAVTLTPAGKILLLGGKHGKSQLIVRLTRSGGLDASFGRTGRLRVITQRLVSYSTIGVDRRERILLGGQAEKQVRGKHTNSLRRSSFVLTRLTEEGSRDRSFGRRGSVRTGFGGPSSAAAAQLYVDAKGRITVVSGLLGTGGGFALARYLGGR
ncbi:MAG: delta-60 repeat domain-containing protein [Solirubrobacterales bacterium]